MLPINPENILFCLLSMSFDLNLLSFVMIFIHDPFASSEYICLFILTSLAIRIIICYNQKFLLLNQPVVFFRSLSILLLIE